MLSLAANQRSDICPRVLNKAAHGAALAVYRRRIAHHIERGKHRGARSRQQRRAGVVVEIGAGFRH